MKLEEQAAMLANRVRKNFRKLHPRFEARSIGAFRLYDRDIPEIRAAVDWYEGHLVVAEYAREQTEGIPWLPDDGGGGGRMRWRCRGSGCISRSGAQGSNTRGWRGATSASRCARATCASW